MSTICLQQERINRKKTSHNKPQEPHALGLKTCWHSPSVVTESRRSLRILLKSSFSSICNIRARVGVWRARGVVVVVKDGWVKLAWKRRENLPVARWRLQTAHPSVIACSRRGHRLRVGQIVEGRHAGNPRLMRIAS